MCGWCCGSSAQIITHPPSHRGTLVIPYRRRLFSTFGLLKLVINQLLNEVRMLLEHAIATQPLQ